MDELKEKISSIIAYYPIRSSSWIADDLHALFLEKCKAFDKRQPVESGEQFPDPVDADGRGQLWVFDPAYEDWCLRHMDSLHEHNSDDCGEWAGKPTWTYWLPFKSLPLPKPPIKDKQ